MNTTITDTKIGTRFEIELLDSLGGKIGSTYTSQLLDIKDSENLTIAAPIQESRLMLIPSGSSIRCIFLHHKLGLVSFTGTVASREKQENIIVINVAVTSKLTRIQRRNHFRLDCMLDAQYRVIEEEGSENNTVDPGTVEFKKAYTKNISGCGACLVTDEPIEKSTYIYSVLILEDGTSIETKCIVVRCTKVGDIELSKYLIGLSFVNISVKDQDTLIRYIFDKQKQFLKRQLR